MNLLTIQIKDKQKMPNHNYFLAFSAEADRKLIPACKKLGILISV